MTREYIDRETGERLVLGDEWKRVYQGGHHDVYCDGITHIQTDGGWVGINDGNKANYKYKCNCEKYGRFTQ